MVRRRISPRYSCSLYRRGRAPGLLRWATSGLTLAGARRGKIVGPHHHDTAQCGFRSTSRSAKNHWCC
eukprot:Skav216587  [mRNA]  locus=scaffold3151:191008:193746:- [translate_table: standard]